MKKTEGLNQIKDSLYSVGQNDIADSIVTNLKDTATSAVFDNLVTAIDSYTTAEQDRRAKKLLGRSSLPEPAYFADLWEYPVRKLDYERLNELLDLEFVKEKRNLVIQGSPGTGKTWFAAVLATRACEKGIRTKWVTFPMLLRELQAKKEKKGKTFDSRLNYYSNFELLCIDEFLNISKDEIEKNTYIIQELFNKLRIKKVPVLITAQFDTSKMDAFFKIQGIGESIKGRGLGSASVLTLTGPNLNLYSEEQDNLS